MQGKQRLLSSSQGNGAGWLRRCCVLQGRLDRPGLPSMLGSTAYTSSTDKAGRSLAQQVAPRPKTFPRESFSVESARNLSPGKVLAQCRRWVQALGAGARCRRWVHDWLEATLGPGLARSSRLEEALPRV